MLTRIRAGLASWLRHALLISWLASLCSLGALRANAEPARVVSVAMRDGTAVDPALWTTLRELCRRIGVELTDEAGRALLSVRLAARPNGMEIALSGENVESVTREVPRAESEDLFRETVAHVVLGMIEPLVEAPPPEPEPEPAPPQPEPAPNARQLRVGVAAGPIWFGHGEVGPRVAASGALGWDRPLGAALGLDLAYSIDPRLERDHVEGRFHLLSLRARPSFAPVRTRHFSLELAVPLGVDLALLHVSRAPPGSVTSARSTRADPIVGAALTARIPLHARFALTVQAGLDVDLTPRRWLVEAGGQTEELFALGRVRPMLLLGVDWLVHETPARSQETP